MMKIIVFALALCSAQSVSARSYGAGQNMRSDDYQLQKLLADEIDSDHFLAVDPKPDVGQSLLSRKTRSASCDSGCNSHSDCSGSNTCNKCCWWFGYGNICTNPNNVIHCISPKFVGVVTDLINRGQRQ